MFVSSSFTFFFLVNEAVSRVFGFDYNTKRHWIYRNLKWLNGSVVKKYSTCCISAGVCRLINRMCMDSNLRNNGPTFFKTCNSFLDGKLQKHYALFCLLENCIIFFF